MIFSTMMEKVELLFPNNELPYKYMQPYIVEYGRSDSQSYSEIVFFSCNPQLRLVHSIVIYRY